jgi:hypothetical protein
MSDTFNELPPGKFGRHVFIRGGWSPRVAKYLDENAFPMATMEGSWDGCGFFADHGHSLRWLRLLNSDKRVEGLSNLHQLEELLLGFEPKDPERLLDLPALKRLEIVCKDPGIILGHHALATLRATGVVRMSDPRAQGRLAEIYLVRPSIDSIACVPNLQSIRRLDVYGARKLTDMNGAERFSALQDVAIESCPSLRDATALVSCRSLRKLSFARTGIERLPAFDSEHPLECIHVGGRKVHVDWDLLLSVHSLRQVALLVDSSLGELSLINAAARSNHKEVIDFTSDGGRSRFVRFRLSNSLEN